MEFQDKQEITDQNLDSRLSDGSQKPFQIQKTIKIEDSAIRQEDEFEINFVPNTTQTKIKSEKKYANPYRAYFPKFYCKEIKNAFISMLASLILLALVSSVSAYGIYWFSSNTINISPWLSMFAIPVIGGPLILAIIQTTRYCSFYQEAKTIDFKSEKIISLNIQKLYKRLKVSYIDICWGSASMYVTMLLTMLITCLVSYWYYKDFGNMVAPIIADNNYVYISIFWSAVGLICATALYQFVGIINAYFRYTRIDNFYNFVLVSEEELKTIKKQKNRRNLVIFLTITAVVTLIFFVAYKLLRRTKTTNVIVK